MIPSNSTAYRRIRRGMLIAASFTGYMTLSAMRTDPEFMRYDAAGRRVVLTIIGRYDESNNGYNFNGGFNGSHRVTVPLGWRVAVTVVNRDVIPHSFALIRPVRWLPLRIDRPALPGAASREHQVGVRTGAREEGIEFVAPHHNKLHRAAWLNEQRSRVGIALLGIGFGRAADNQRVGISNCCQRFFALHLSGCGHFEASLL